MEKKHVKMNKQSLLYTPIGILLLAIVLLYIVYKVYGVYVKWGEAHTNLSQAENVYTATVSRHNAIAKDIQELETPRGKEEIIREKFDVVRDGEGVVVLPEEDSSLTEDSMPKNGTSKGFWYFLKHIFTRD